MNSKEKAFELLGHLAGGGLAGLADVEMSQHMPLGLPVGAIGGLAAVAVGFFAKGKVGEHAMNVGQGALAFEAGTAVVNRVLAAKATASQSVAGLPMGRPQVLPGQRPVTADALRSHFARMHQAA